MMLIPNNFKKISLTPIAIVYDILKFTKNDHWLWLLKIYREVGDWKNSEMFETAPRRQIEIS